MKSRGKIPNSDRNEALVVLSKEAPKYYSLNRLSRVFDITKQGAKKIKERDWNLYSLKKVKAKDKAKGKQLSTD